MSKDVVVIMDDLEVRIENVDDDEIPAMLDSGFVSAVLMIIDNEIRYAGIDWDEYKVKEWKKPEYR